MNFHNDFDIWSALVLTVKNPGGLEWKNVEWKVTEHGLCEGPGDHSGVEPKLDHSQPPR